MIFVKTHSRADGATGLMVGAGNVRRFFAEQQSAIELDLGHFEIQCELGPKFWQDEPVIHDPRLNAWLEAKYLHGQRERESVPLALVPNGEHCYRLQTVERRPAAKRVLRMPRKEHVCAQELIDSKYEAALRSGSTD